MNSRSVNMAKILRIFFVLLLVTILHGFPQNPHQGQPDNHGPPGKQDTNPHLRRGQSKPLQRSQISTLPASINSEKGDNQQHKNTNRKIRETDEEIKPLDRSQISTLPADIKFEDAKTKHSSEESSDKTKNREIRKAGSDDSSEEDSKEKIKPADIQIQPYRPGATKHDSSEENDRETRNTENKDSEENKAENVGKPLPADIKIQPYRPTTEPRRY